MTLALDSAAVYRQGAYGGARPDPEYWVSEWADKYRWLTDRSSPEPGPWRTSRTPYLKAIMDDLSPRSRCEQVVVMAGSQLGKTECGNNWIGFVIHMAPGPMLAVQPTTQMAERNSKQRIAPLIASSTVLSKLVREPRQRDSGNTILSKEFPGGVLVMTGANSATGLRSMPARYLFLDEVDGYPGDVEGEGEPCALAIARTRNYARRKILVTSTPVVSGRSRIERFYEASDRRQLWVPCPNCGEFITLSMEHLHWPTGRPREAKYHCEACGKPIDNHQKTWMLKLGEWRAQERNDRVHGYYLPSFYSPVGWLSWGEIAEQREKAGNDQDLIRVFTNTILGLPYADAAEVPDAERLYERREGYEIGVVPRGGLVLTAGVDVQARRLECEVVAWGRNKESWSVNYFRFDGDTTQPDVWRQLSELLDEEFRSEYGQRMRIRRMAVDTGFNTMTVYEWVRRQQRSRVMAIKGQTRIPAVVGVPSLIEPGPYGARVKWGIRLWPTNTNIGKEELYRRLREPMPDLARGESWPAGYCHFPAYGKEYFEQLTSEVLVTKTVAGKRTTKWELVRDRNEALDCRVYARAAAASLSLENWRPERWDALEATLSDPSAQPAPASPVGTPVAARKPPAFTPMRQRTDWLE